ncbi:endonuclease III [Candidatus Gracilibacteria bacterium]|nr:endonuclease III [Candidatus Gracilibacteria bacterium]
MKKIDPNIFTERLMKHYSAEKCHLDWDAKRPWTLLFAVILSAQCTDKRVNMVTPKLFQEFPDLESYVARPLKEIEHVIHSTGFFRSKAKALKGSAEKILLDFKGEIPSSMENLIQLPGVARKTANVILWNIFHKNEGFVVDTHVGRIAQRTGLSQEKTPKKIEKDLMRQLSQEHWGELSHMLVQFGRDTCKAPTPKCSECFFGDVCPRNGVDHSK